VIRKVETIIVGGGQAGLAVGYYLKEKGREFKVLEAAERPAHAWRDDRWDSFCLVTPNWTFRLPGSEYDGPDPQGYMGRDEIVQRLENYIRKHDIPIQHGVRVTAVEPADSGYRVETDSGDWEADHVVVATGLYQSPNIPTYDRDFPKSVLQIHSGQYRNPDTLPAGAVLVVGSAQSGCQIAEELYQAGRKVFLCVCSAGRAPRHYRERDVFEWLVMSGFFNRTPEKLPSAQARFAGNPHLSGKNGGHSINLHQFHRDGVTLLGRLQGTHEGVISLAPDLKENLIKVDTFETNIVKLIDETIAREGIDAPVEELPSLQDGFAAPEILSLDLKEAGITTVIWARGYSFDFHWIKLPLLDEFGFPITQQGVTRYPGIFITGLPWLPSQKTGIFLGIGEQAAYIARQIGGL